MIEVCPSPPRHWPAPPESVRSERSRWIERGGEFEHLGGHRRDRGRKAAGVAAVAAVPGAGAAALEERQVVRAPDGDPQRVRAAGRVALEHGRERGQDDAGNEVADDVA